MASTGSHLAPNQRLSVTTTRNSLKLEIQKVVPEDEGEYQCVATNQYGEATIKRFFGAQSKSNLCCLLYLFRGRLSNCIQRGSRGARGVCHVKGLLTSQVT